MKSKTLQWFAIILIVEMGLLHFFTAQREYDEAAYLGYLFIANFLGALISAYGIYSRQAWGWIVGLALAAGSIAGYIWSRTLGMPGMVIEGWLDAYGLVALAVECLFILLVLLRPWRIASAALGGATPRPVWQLYMAPVIAIFSLTLISYSTYQWDRNLDGPHKHVGTLAEVCSTPVISLAQLEQEYGIKVSLVASTMMGGIIDVRLKIVDPDKAHALLTNQAALLVNQQSLVLAPHLHTHYKLKPGKLFNMFFSSERSLIHTGSSVGLVFGSVRIAPVTVQ